MYLRGRRPRRRRRRRMAACSRPIRSWRATWVRGQAQLIQLCLRIGYALQELSLAVLFVLYLALLLPTGVLGHACVRGRLGGRTRHNIRGKWAGGAWEISHTGAQAHAQELGPSTWTARHSSLPSWWEGNGK